ncbi:hypothetical protein MPNT_10322 [Candidatus Methylacidithermus pantelleriae]|uniref:Uncharacterized protein n=1 Tax=Candidatus Methylacidithermus pantelleriae TaxID=2744239 RepID=A0A8J2BMH5_9BACT|nr:hypothetical protein MPNT_10322 [Candidatus Methylacidithermus pantelleriae]
MIEEREKETFERYRAQEIGESGLIKERVEPVSVMGERKGSSPEDPRLIAWSIKTRVSTTSQLKTIVEGVSRRPSPL